VALCLHKAAQNTQMMNNGMNSGSRKGRATAKSISPTIAMQPKITRATPAKTKARSIATQKRMTVANINFHIPIVSPRGPVSCFPFTLIDTSVVELRSAHPSNAIIRITKIKASFVIIIRFLFPGALLFINAKDDFDYTLYSRTGKEKGRDLPVL
jgi:hypothetical protein